eukprot:NODE_180_length_15790_cov_0.586706.p7 type:complete len:168 gc:universal NODE_180_length_15790_cov_0.586706:763-1266(+)
MSLFVLDKIFFDGDCVTPWLLTRESIRTAQTCLDYNSIRCTNNTLSAFYSQACTYGIASKEINFDYVKATTIFSKKYGGPYEYVYRADGKCRQFSTLTGPHGLGVVATCNKNIPQIQQCDESCNKCVNVNMSTIYSDYSCKVYPNVSYSPSLISVYILLAILINIFN